MKQRALPVHLIDSVKDEAVHCHTPGLYDGEYANVVFRKLPIIYTTDNYRDQESIVFNSEELLDNEDSIKCKQLSTAHVRSFEILDPKLPSVWIDEHNQPFGSFNLKGNNFSYAGLMESATASEGIIAYGLQESAYMRRILRGSRLLQMAGVTTVKIIGVAEPLYFPTPIIGRNVDYHENLCLGDYKNHLIMKYWTKLDESQRSPESLLELHNKLSRMTFYITLRAMDTSYRLSELFNVNAQEHAFAIANATNLKPSDSIEYDTSNTNEIYRFLEEVTIPRLAKNFARMHNAGLAHRFPVSGNITALGSIVDLDSLHGSPLELGDEPITTVDIVRDLALIISDLSVFKRQENNYKNYINIFLDLYIQNISTLPLKDKLINEEIYNATSKLRVDEEFLNIDPIDYQIIRYLTLIEDKFPLQIFEYQKNLLVDSINKWLKENNNIIENVVVRLTKRMNELAGLILYETPHANLNVSYINKFLDNEFADNYIISSEYLSGLIDESICAEFLDSGYIECPIIDKDQFLGRFVNFWRGVHNDHDVDFQIIGEYLRICLEELIKLTTITVEKSIIVNSTSEILFQTQGSLFAISTEKVSINKLIHSLEINPSIEVIIASYKDLSIQDDSNDVEFYYINYELSDAANVLIEVITDGRLDLVSHDPDDKVRNTYTEISKDALYVAYVEKQPNGKLSVVLQINTPCPEGYDKWENIPTTKAIELIKNIYVHQGKLFDDSSIVSHTLNENLIFDLELK